MFRFGALPEGEILWVALIAADGFTAAGFLRFQLAVAELAISRSAADVKIDVAIGDIGVAAGDEILRHADLLGNVSAGAGGDIGALDAECVHIGEVFARIMLDELHRSPLHLGCFLEDAVFVGGEQVADVGDILDVEQIVAGMAQPAGDGIEGDVGLAWPMCDSSCTVGPQTYIPTCPSTSGTKSCFWRPSTLKMRSAC